MKQACNLIQQISKVEREKREMDIPLKISLHLLKGVDADQLSSLRMSLHVSLSPALHSTCSPLLAAPLHLIVNSGLLAGPSTSINTCLLLFLWYN